MKIGLAADHGGYDLKQSLRVMLETGGHDVFDYGAARFVDDDDYPDYVLPLARAIGKGAMERGIAICTSGVGACIVANKVRHVRAALISDPFSARQGVEDNNMNMMCLGGQVIGQELARELTKRFLVAQFSPMESNKRRLSKIARMEQASWGKESL